MSATPSAPAPRTLAEGQRCRVRIHDLRTHESTTVLETWELLLEAPNWHRHGRLVLNGDGSLWTLDVESGALAQIAIDGVPDLNNDHVLAPDGVTVYVSANDFHLYAAPLAGGEARRVTGDDHGRLHFLHGISPDGTTLAYIGLQPEGDEWWARAEVFTVSTDGTGDTRLPQGGSPADGSEYSPDGAWIYFNTELFTETPGHAQIARMRPDGRDVERLTYSDRVDWFPHPSPDGARAVYLSYPSGTVGHPADRPVELRLVEADAWDRPATIVSLQGGQGTINVNSWAPDSQRFAYVDYPRDEA
ncbi:biopolymer transporter Tol [Demequina capsici]|uniref:Biopolymer transporter Tol n=1 Tax=Demequina capsici TaxID=3075620 RepID=A0AA96FD03_9MICO|nr:biopolymer transporter Tol [Demequina sp. PMTSA13]WNM27272.1 biopolymer transporter Tol [Demequina sp. PMTSA13]